MGEGEAVVVAVWCYLRSGDCGDHEEEDAWMLGLGEPCQPALLDAGRPPALARCCATPREATLVH